MANLYMKADMVRYIGTDPAEWWKGRELEAALPSHLAQIKDEICVAFEVDEVEAYELGNVGWALVSAQASFGGMEPVPFRITFVFVLADGVWRVVQNHNSLALAPTPMSWESRSPGGWRRCRGSWATRPK